MFRNRTFTGKLNHTKLCQMGLALIVGLVSTGAALSKEAVPKRQAKQPAVPPRAVVAPLAAPDPTDTQTSRVWTDIVFTSTDNTAFGAATVRLPHYVSAQNGIALVGPQGLTGKNSIIEINCNPKQDQILQFGVRW